MRPWKVATVLGLAGFVLVVLVPFWWIATMSFKPSKLPSECVC